MRDFMSNLTIAKKSLLPLGLMAVVTVGLSSYLIHGLINVDNGFSSLLDNEVKAELLATNINGALDTISSEGYQSIAENEESRIRPLMEALEKSKAENIDNFEKLRKLVEISNPDTVKELPTELENVKKSIDSAIAAAKLSLDQKDANALVLMDQEFVPAFKKASDDMDKIQADIDKDTQNTAAQLRADSIRSRNISIALLTLSVLISVIAGFRISKTGIVDPVYALTDAMRKLADSDWDTEVPGTLRLDEIGTMAKTVEIFKTNGIEAERLRGEQAKEQQKQLDRAKNIDKLVTDFEKTIAIIVHTVSSASTELQSTAEIMSASAEETSKQSNTVAAASEEATANVQTVASATEELSASIREIQERVSDSSMQVNQAADQAIATNNRVQELSEASIKIGAVVSLISDIAAQTNLLALNATIEAARAGEAGKGFAVVASEVKALAGQTAKATEEISLQIKNIQQASGASASAIQNIANSIDAVRKTSTAISAAVEEQGSATQEIARNVTEAAMGTKDVCTNIVSVSQAAQNTGAASAQVLSAASELSKNGENLRIQVDTFLQAVRIA